MGNKKTFKVLVPVEKHNGGGTFWLRIGSAYVNKDESINVYLDVIPKDAKLQLRELTEEDFKSRDARQGSIHGVGSAMPPPSAATEQTVPF